MTASKATISYNTSVCSIIGNDAKSLKYEIRRTSVPVNARGTKQYAKMTTENIDIPELTIRQATVLAQEILNDLAYLANAADVNQLD